jgi:hypothetical protein
VLPEVFPAVWNPDLNAVLVAPQPLDAWSRARWMPMAQKLGADTIGHAVLEQQLSPQERVRAIEVLTEMFHGLTTQEARIAARDTVPAIRARVAWSLGRAPCAGFVPILLPLALDQHPHQRVADLSRTEWSLSRDQGGLFRRLMVV